MKRPSAVGLDLDIGGEEALPGHLVPDEPDGILGGVAIEKPAPELDFVAERLEAAVFAQLRRGQGHLGRHLEHAALVQVHRRLQADQGERRIGTACVRALLLDLVPAMAEEILVLRAVEVDLAERDVEPPALHAAQADRDRAVLPQGFSLVQKGAGVGPGDPGPGRQRGAGGHRGAEDLQTLDADRQHDPTRLVRLDQVPGRQGVQHHVEQDRVDQEIGLGNGSEQPVPRQHLDLALHPLVAGAEVGPHPLEQRAVEQVVVGPFDGERRRALVGQAEGQAGRGRGIRSREDHRPLRGEPRRLLGPVGEAEVLDLDRDAPRTLGRFPGLHAGGQLDDGGGLLVVREPAIQPHVADRGDDLARDQDGGGLGHHLQGEGHRHDRHAVLPGIDLADLAAADGVVRGEVVFAQVQDTPHHQRASGLMVGERAEQGPRGRRDRLPRSSGDARFGRAGRAPHAAGASGSRTVP